MKLLVDIGNSRLKSALLDGARWQALDAVPNDTVDAALWKDIQKPDAVWIASVASPALNARVAEHVSQRFQLAPTFVRSSAVAAGVRNAYARPERLGVDRFLALIAVHAQGLGDAVICSCGTALTLDALRPDGQHLGGLIAPSPALMQRSLRSGAAQLREFDEADVVDIAADTDAAIVSGTWLAAVALTERFLDKAAERCGGEPRLILTGGGATRLAGLLARPSRLEPDLVLRGLARLAVG